MNPTPSRGVPVELDKTRFLRYSLKTHNQIRKEFGDDTNITGERLAKLLWYGLVGDDPNLTVEDVEELVDLEHLDAIVEAVSKAMGRAGKASVVMDPPTRTGSPSA